MLLVLAGSGGVRVHAVDALAAAEGLHPGQLLADARMLVPYLRAVAAEPGEDAAALGRLADWTTRYTPFAAVDGEDGLALDISGAAHLFGGEAALIDDLARRLAGYGVSARLAIADTPAAAWAWARFGRDAILPKGEIAARTAILPVEALRLPAEIVAVLRRLGLYRIGDVLKLPRGPLAARFGAILLQRRDRLLGHEAEPISPRRPVTRWCARRNFAEPIMQRDGIDATLRLLLDELCATLARDGRGARLLELACYRVDSAMQTIAIGTSRPVHAAVPLMRLFAEKLGSIAPGFGIETMVLSAIETDAFITAQAGLDDRRAGESDGLAEILDRLRNRLGADCVSGFVAQESHLPERAVTLAAADDLVAAQSWLSAKARPLRLLPTAEKIEVSGGANQPTSFTWRRQRHPITAAEGPERISSEWWRRREDSRDYYWVEDGQGQRYWIYRRVAVRDWYLQGLFA